MTDIVEAPRSQISLTRLLGTSMCARLLVDTGTQIFNPFLGIFAAGLGVDVVQLGRLVSLRSAMGLTAPLFGAFADRAGYRVVMRLGLLLSCSGFLVMGASSSTAMFAAGMVLTGLGAAGFVPTVQAYICAQLPYSQRARSIGILEYSWAVTGIVGLSAIGILIEVVGWRAPFFVLSGGLLIMWFVFGAMPSARGGSAPARDVHDGAKPIRLPSWEQTRSFFRLGSNARSAYSLMLVGSLSMFAAIQIMITHGVWLNTEYGLGPAQLGTVALVMGLFDLCGSVSVSLFTDRIGKRRSVLIGTCGALAGYLLLPWLNIGVTVAVLSIAATRGFFEFAIVSNIPLMSEQIPQQRGKVMTLGAAAGLLGSTLASFTGPWLYTVHGVWGVATVSAVASAIALVLLLTLVQERSGD